MYGAIAISHVRGVLELHSGRGSLQIKTVVG
jgi:hypothetical protein